MIATDPLVGKVLYSEDSVLMPISSFKVFGQLSLFGLWVVMIFAGFFTFIILSILNLLKGEKYKMAFKINVFPTITSLFIILTFFLRYYGFENADLLFSTPNLLAVSLLVSSSFFVVGIMLSFLHLFMSFHLVYYGFIPLITWA